MATPVRHQSRRRLHVEGHVRACLGGAEHVAEGSARHFHFGEQHEAADFDADGVIGLESEQPRGAAVENRIGVFDLKQQGVDRRGLVLEQVGVFLGAGVDVGRISAVFGRHRRLGVDHAVAGLDLFRFGEVAVPADGALARPWRRLLGLVAVFADNRRVVAGNSAGKVGCCCTVAEVGRLACRTWCTARGIACTLALQLARDSCVLSHYLC
jgi:hypothetical protein